ncbi:MAG: Dyp-type peroxidase [Gammaproteobacteria bacterium]|nr:Dyp-type peroxidase [Gammaproteobacteria bacterium]
MIVKTPQLGIFKGGAQHFYFLEYSLGKGDLSNIKSAVSTSLALANTKGVTCVLSFGEQAWQTFQPKWCPETLTSFTRLNGQQGHTAPSTQADLFFWLQGACIAEVFDGAMAIHNTMQSVANLKLEQRGFDYHHSTDLIGFEDGTANPKTDVLKRQAAVIPENRKGAGGSLVLSQKWVHDLTAWNNIPVHCQEAIVGRTKTDNIELEGEAMPDDSHINRTDLTVEGEAMKIYRRSAPYGTVTEHGLLFLAFACDLKRFSSQLESMYGLTEDKKIDQLLNFSKAVSGSYWFAPAVEDLQEVLQ